MPPGLGKPGVRTGERFPDRHAVHHDEMSSSVTVIHRDSERDVAAAIMAYHRKPVMSENFAST